MVEAQCTPSIILTGLHDDVGILECSTEEGLDEATPFLLLTGVGSTHVIQIDISDLLLLLPLVASGDHLLDAGTIHTVDPTEDADVRQLTGFLRRKALLDELLLCGDGACSDVVLLIFLAERSDQLDGLRDQRQARCCEVTELSRGLDDHVDTWATQLGGGDQANILDRAKLRAHGLDAEHIQHLGDSHPFGLDEFTAPEGIADLRGILAVLLLVGLQRSLSELYALTPRTLRRCALSTDRIEVATRRHSLWVGDGITTRRGCGEAPVEGIDRSIKLEARAILQGITIGDDVEDSTLQLGDGLHLIPLLLRWLGRVGSVSLRLTPWVTARMTSGLILEATATDLIKAGRLASRLTAIALGCCHSCLHTHGLLRCSKRMDTLQLLLRDATIGEDGSFAHRARGEDATDQLLSGLEVLLIEAVLIACIVDGLSGTQAIQSSLGVSDGVSRHRQHRGGRLRWGVGHARDIELTIDLL